LISGGKGCGKSQRLEEHPAGAEALTCSVADAAPAQAVPLLQNIAIV
jgi:hypothetical protein